MEGYDITKSTGGVPMLSVVAMRISSSNCLAVIKDTGCRILAIDEPIAHRVM